MEFRLLRADEIDVRISSVGSWGVQLLLYKDARVDQTILDETVGPMNWQRHHTRDNANCIVSIWDSEKGQWIEKEDTGNESFTEKEKGLASDSFKRACFNWGLGRELYTAPNMFVYAKDLKTLEERNGKWTCKDYFEVTDIEYQDRKISRVQIKNTKTGRLMEFGSVVKQEACFSKAYLSKHGKDPINDEQIRKLTEACEAAGGNLSLENAVAACRKNSVNEITVVQYLSLCEKLGIAA